MDLRKIFKKILLSLTVLFIVFGFCQNSYASENLSDKQKSIALISSYTSKGDLTNLEKALNNGLDKGLTINEIKEVLVQVYAYAGFPRSLNGISTFKKVLDTRKANGINDILGEEGQPLPAGTDKKSYGNNVQIELIGAPTSGDYITFTPAIDTFLKEHLFADIFCRGVLTYQEREISTVAILSTLNGLEPQLKGHMMIALHIGLTPKQVKEILVLTNSKSGIKILSEITNDKNIKKISDNTKPAKIEVLRGQTLERIPVSKDNFNGNAQMARILPADNPMNISTGIVYFEKNAKTNWHTHPVGQLIIIASGHGQVQQEGGEIIDVYAGDAVWFPPYVKHWHGAAPDETMSHYAFAGIENGKSADWFEKVER